MDRGFKRPDPIPGHSNDENRTIRRHDNIDCGRPRARTGPAETLVALAKSERVGVTTMSNHQPRSTPLQQPWRGERASLLSEVANTRR